MVATIEVTDVGPVEHLSIPIPEDGGLVVLRGANGSGKSSLLKAVDRLATGKKDIAVSARDGAPRGQLSGLGVTLRVGRSISRTGELEVESLDGRLSVAELVDPGMKGAEEADNRRIKALVQLAGVKPDIGLFSGLLDDPEWFAAIVKGKNLETDDILVLADRIKRAIDEAARNAEGVANIERAKAAACREAAAGVNVDVETDEQILQAAMNEATSTDATLREKARAAEKRAAEIDDARQQIKARTACKPGETLASLEECRQREAHCHNQVADARDNVSKLEKALQEARWDLERAEDRLADSRRDLANVEQFHAALAELEAIASAGEIEAPTDEELEAAAEAVIDAREAIEAGALARQAIEKRRLAAEHADLEAAAVLRAETLREAAKRVDDVLSEQIAKLGVPLEVKAGRLYAKKTRRGSTLYAELSEGERWRMALDIAIEAVGENGLLSIPQVAFEGLDPENRRLIGEHVKGRKVVILTAEATDGPIRAEID